VRTPLVQQHDDGPQHHESATASPEAASHRSQQDDAVHQHDDPQAEHDPAGDAERRRGAITGVDIVVPAAEPIEYSPDTIAIELA